MCQPVNVCKKVLCNATVKEYINAIKTIYKNYALLKKIRVTQNSLKLLSRCLEDYSSCLNKRSEVDIFADIKAMHIKNLSENVMSNFREVDDKNCYIYLFEKEIEHTIECLKNVNKKKFSKSEVEELYEVLSTLLENTL